MEFKTNKEKGCAGLSLAIAYFGSNGYTVSIPLNDTQDYDLIIDKNNILSKVQVKAVGYQTKDGVYQVSLKNSGGTKGHIYGRVCESKIDFIFVLCEDSTMYLIPFDVIKDNRASLNLGEKLKEYKVKM